jgi:hypothetical protein
MLAPNFNFVTGDSLEKHKDSFTQISLKGIHGNNSKLQIGVSFQLSKNPKPLLYFASKTISSFYQMFLEISSQIKLGNMINIFSIKDILFL